jgi:hypothetical protein
LTRAVAREEQRSAGGVERLGGEADRAPGAERSTAWPRGRRHLGALDLEGAVPCVADVASTVAVEIGLRGIRSARAGVGGADAHALEEAAVAEAVAVGVGAGIAGVADSVVIAVGLERVEDRRTEIDRVAGSVAVRVGVVRRWTGIAGVAERIRVGVALVRIHGVRTVVGRTLVPRCSGSPRPSPSDRDSRGVARMPIPS